MTSIDIDFKDEIEPFLEYFKNYRIRENELISSSPFREDNSPSFSLNLETGLWIDFGSNSEIWNKGNFFKLISFLTGEHYEEVFQEYTLKYKGLLNEIDKYELNILLDPKREYRTFNLADYPFNSYKTDYLTERGITEKAQQSFRIGYDTNNKAISIPYFDKNGNVVNIKFRKVNYKQFYYLPDGQQIANHVYGLDKIQKFDFTHAFVVESEIDCMYLWSYGIPAIALGTAHMSRRQEELIKLSKINTLTLAFDNDLAGRKATHNVAERLIGHMELEKLKLPKQFKDVNDLSISTIKSRQFTTEKVSPMFKI